MKPDLRMLVLCLFMPGLASAQVTFVPDTSRAILTHARAQAETAAAQMGVRVTGVRSINLEGPSRQGIVQTYASSVASSGGQPAARFLPGSIRVVAEIPVVFTIDDRT